MTINVDPKEIQKFEALAYRWWDENSEFKPLHDINPLRLDYIEQGIDGLQNKNVIDVGCGGGILSESMALRGANVLGIDMGKTPLEVARLHSLDTKVDIEYRQVTAEDIAEEQAEHYDVVTCMEMLEHVPSPESIIMACAKLAKPNGDLFFSTINRNPKAFLLAIAGAEYILNLLPKGTHDYAKFIKPSELESQTRAAGLTLKSIIGLQYNPLFQTYKLNQNVDVNYIIHCKKEC